MILDNGGRVGLSIFSLEFVVIGLQVLLCLIGIGMWVAKERRIAWASSLGVATARTYQLLEQTHRGLFRGSKDVRFTIFVPDSESPSSGKLRAGARLGWGRPSAHAQVRFGPNEGLAGMAWMNPDSLLVARLGPFDTREEFEEASVQLLRIQRSTARSLSREQWSAQVVVAASLTDCGRWFRGVLCIDCRDPSLIPPPSASKEFWIALASVASEIASTMAISENLKPMERPIGEFLPTARVDEIRLQEGLMPEAQTA